MIKVGMNVSYDWLLLKKALPRIYEHADQICFSIDKNRRTWQGQPFPFDEHDFKHWLATVDTHRKIDVYEDDFSLPNLSAMENDTRQRLKMAERMGKGGWHLQVDSDEYFLDFKEFVATLKKIHPNPTGHEKGLNVCVCCIPLIKKVTHGYLYVDFKDALPELAPIATNLPQYDRARHSGHFNIITSSFIVHETWARSDSELLFKISNWGHSSDELKETFIRQSYYALWKSLDEFNCQYVTNFHPAEPKVWPALVYAKVDSVEDFLETLDVSSMALSTTKLMLRNNRNIARVKGLWNKLTQ